LNGYLWRHGVEAIWHREGQEPQARGELLLSRAFDLAGADGALIAGCAWPESIRARLVL